MSIKALWDKKTLKILGAQIVGFDGVDKRMDVLAAVIRFGAKSPTLWNSSFAMHRPLVVRKIRSICLVLSLKTLSQEK